MSVRSESNDRDAVDILRRQLLRVVVGSAAVVIGLAALMIAIDLSGQDDDWDGLMAWVGTIVAVPSLVIGSCALLALRAGSRAMAGLTAGLVTALGVLIASHSPWGLGLFLLGATLLVTAFVPRERHPIDSGE